MGKVIAICTSPARGTQKKPVPSARFTVDWGIEGDAHGGRWHRQVSLLSADKIEAFNARGANVQPGAFGENLVVEGFDFRSLPVGTLLRCGSVLLEMTQIGKECHSHCEIYKKMGECIMPREGVFARVLVPGEIHVGDEMVLEPRTAPRPWQAAVVTLSDKGARGERKDESGPAIARRLEEAGYEVVEQLLLADEAGALRAQLIRLADQRQLDLILTTGGTGFGPPGYHAGSHFGSSGSHGPRHCRSHAGGLSGHHASGHAFPRGVGPSEKDPDHQPARKPQGLYGVYGCLYGYHPPRDGPSAW